MIISDPIIRGIIQRELEATNKELGAYNTHVNSQVQPSGNIRAYSDGLHAKLRALLDALGVTHV